MIGQQAQQPTIGTVKEEIRLPDLPAGVSVIEFASDKPEMYEVNDTKGQSQGISVATPFRVISSDNPNIMIGQTYRLRITKFGVFHDGPQNNIEKSSGYRALQQALSLVKCATKQVGVQMSEEQLNALQQQWLSGQFAGRRILVTAIGKTAKTSGHAYIKYAFSPLAA